MALLTLCLDKEKDLIAVNLWKWKWRNASVGLQQSFPISGLIVLIESLDIF